MISDYVKTTDQIEGVCEHIRELPRDMTIKEWIQIQKVSDGLVIGEQEDAPYSSSS